ncbi:MAG TPA: peptidylprolyl isomerase [Sphingomonadaceae bacterium]|jgi:hypothetical protein|nr:peptidylprolyl isomerase [Sphingomonadaceae bacterium]
MTDDAPWSFDKPSGRRSLILCALGALAGLGIAGFGLFTAHGTRTSHVPAEDVALVNQTPLLMSDYISQLRALYDVPLSEATAEQKKKVLDDMIREELYVQRGVELGMQSDTTEVRNALVGAVEAQASADAAMAQPSEPELRRWFEARQANYALEGRMTLRDYILPPGGSGEAAAAALRAKGATPATLARFGLRSSGKVDDDEEFYFAARIHLGDRLFAVAKGLDDGAVSPPVPQADGTHILVMQVNHRPIPQAYEDVRPKVLTDYTAEQAKRLLAGNDRFLRKRADILIAKGFE